MRCERKAEKMSFNSSTVQFYPAANVKVKTTTGDYRVDLYEMIDGPVADRLQRIEATLAALQFDTATRFEQLGTLKEGTSLQVNSTRVGGDGKVKACPPGHFVSAVVAPDGVGGKYAVDALKTLRFTCTPINGK